MAIIVGARLGRYEVRSLLGAGGMGEVYLAHDATLDRAVALKILPAALVADEDRAARFVREAKAASALNHPHILTIYEIGEASVTGEARESPANESSAADSVVHYIAMEFVDGVTLRDLIHGERIDLTKSLKYLAQVADGLAKAHAAGIVHRDLKPDNIMVTRDGYAKLLDFGLAKLVEQPSPLVVDENPGEAETAAMPQHSTPGKVMGTVGYMSPEQARGQVVDRRSDIFSFGCILYEAATRKRAFEGDSAIDTLHKIIYAQAAPIRDLNPLAPADLQRIVRRCLAKDPEERFQTIKDVAIELKELRREMVSEAGLEHSVTPPFSASSSRSGGAISGQASGGMSGAGSTGSAAQESAPPTAETIGASDRATMSGGAGATASGGNAGAEARGRSNAIIIGALALVAVAAIGFSAYQYMNRSDAPASPSSARSTNMRVTRLTNDGRNGGATISLDGRYVAYSSSVGGRGSLWVRHVATNSAVQIVPPTDDNLYGISFSPDGDFVYYTMFEQATRTSALFEIPVLGGTPRRVLSNIISPVTFSPDGRQMAFVRANPVEGSLIIVNRDGSAERSLAVRRERQWFDSSGPSWSPDGEMIACSIADEVGGVVRFTVAGYRATDGNPVQLTSQTWSGAADRVAWLGDKSGIVVSARTDEASLPQLWLIAYPGGEARRITNDLNSYGTVSLGVTRDSSTILTVQEERTQRLWTMPLPASASNPARQITGGREDGGGGDAWTPDNRIVFTARTGDNQDIWIMDADGGNRRQLTNDAFVEASVRVSPDGRYIVFSANRSGGAWHLWRIDIDGGNARQLTDREDYSPDISPDGQTVLFVSWRAGRAELWRVSIDGGEAVRVSDRQIFWVNYSPDGTRVLCRYYDDATAAQTTDGRLGVMPSDASAPPTPLDLPPNASDNIWFDDRTIIYAEQRNDAGNVWLRPIDGGTPRQITNFTSDRIFSLTLARDRRQLLMARGTVTSDLILIRDFR